MPDPLLSRSVFARFAIVFVLGLWVVACAASGARAEWKDMNSVINQTNFIVADQCSGTLISLKYKLVLTNDHCLEGYIERQEKDEIEPGGEVKKVTREVFKDMELKQKAYQGFEEVGSSSYQAKILFHVHKYDLAVLQIKADAITQTVYSHILPVDKTVARGDAIFVVGNPFMLDANLNEGHISSVSRKIQWDDGEDIPYFGVDAGVNPGNSGGALYNADGELIGVPGASMRGATGLGFAIPVTLIRKVLKENCYEAVYNADPAVKDHEACEQDKLDRENELRAKAGLPPKEAPKEQWFGGDAATPRVQTLVPQSQASRLRDWLEALPFDGASAAATRPQQ
jgi:V8-like Glu-specific endopeptidase